MRSLLLTALVLLPFAASGSDAPYRPATAGPFVAYTTGLPPRGGLILQPILGWSFTRGALGANGAFEPLGPAETYSAGTALLYAQYGVFPWLGVGVFGGVQHTRRTLGAEAASATRPLDTLLFAQARVLEEQRGRLWPDVALFGGVKLPTGRASPARVGTLGTDVTGTGSVDMTLGVNLTRAFEPFLVHVDALFTGGLPAEVAGVTTRYAPSFGWAAAAELPLPWNTWPLALMVELAGRHQGLRREEGLRVAGSQVHELVAGAGVELLFSDEVQLLMGYQRTLLGSNVLASDAVIVTLVPLFF